MNADVLPKPANTNAYSFIVASSETTLFSRIKENPPVVTDSNVLVISASGSIPALFELDLSLPTASRSEERLSVSEVARDSFKDGDNRPELSASNDVISSIRAMFGKWTNREDITDEWLDEIRGTWGGRLADLYDQDSD